MRPLPFAASCLLLLIFAFSALADTPTSTNLRPDILYTHRGEFVQVKSMRPLTLNAHVEQFAYDPLGIEIAYAGSEPQGENTLHFVKTIDARTGHEISRLTLTASAGQDASFLLLGFSTSGKYLLLREFAPDPTQQDKTVSEFLRWDLSANRPVAQTIDPKAALPAGAVPVETELNDGYASPDGRWIAFNQYFHNVDADGKPGPDKPAYLLYDPERDTFKLLSLPPNVVLSHSWADASHLKIWQDSKRKQLDVLTGQISPLPENTKLDPPPASKQYPDLSLSYEQQDLEDKQDKGSGGHVPACIVWIHRTAFGKIPFGAAAAGLMPYGNVSSRDIANPEAAWSPTGRQVAFLANDDLYITDLMTATGPLPSEKLAVGLTLTCAEEQILAMSDLKRIGLGLIQFTQDNDENYPAAGDFMAKVYPFIKTMNVFSVSGHTFVYEQPADLALAKMESPATTENGYLDLPCARIVLFADGHVKAFPKQETAP